VLVGRIALLLVIVWCLLQVYWYPAGQYPPPPPLEEWVTWTAHFTAPVEKEWVQDLRHQPVRSSFRFAPADAASHKFIVHFADGKVALAKPLACFNWILSRTPIVFDPIRHDGYEAIDDATCQGWPDIIGYHLDRLLGLYRKPPAVGRRLSNKELYSGAVFFTLDLPNTLNWLLWWLPAYDIDCVLLPWLQNFAQGTATWARLQSKPVIRFLSQPTPHTPLMADASLPALRGVMIPAEAYFVLDVADTLVFDFLLEDHDRQAEKNWVTMNLGSPTDPSCPRLAGSWQGSCLVTILLWDSGLAFRHGPLGRHDDLAEDRYSNRHCLTVLKGSNIARNIVNQNATHSYLCRFRRTTYHQLLSWTAVGRPSLTALLESRLRQDPLFPHFRFGIYNNPAAFWWDRRVFASEAFFEGIELRLRTLLIHISACVGAFGEAATIIDDDLLAAALAATDPRFPTGDADDWTPEELREIGETMRNHGRAPAVND
jgi:hypothetical protein